MGLFVVLTLGWGAWAAVTARGVERDLTQADVAVDRLQAAVDTGDDASRTQALADLQTASASAAARTDGPLWASLTLLPVVGDDAAGVEALASSLDVLANDALAPLLESADELSTLTEGGRIDPVAVAALQAPVARANAAADVAAADVASLDSSGYIGRIRGRFDDYVNQVSDLATGLDSAEIATQVLPGMLGADGPRDYLFIFQNNAEIRATGGLPGSWARVHVDDGVIELREQGASTDFPSPDGTVLPLTSEEQAVYGQPLGQFWQNPGMTPDFPRAAELFRGHWDRKYPDIPLSGVLALDPVGMSYLLRGTGPVTAGEVELTSDNLVDQVLNQAYVTLPVEAQDAYFQAVAGSLFDAVTRPLASPVEFVRGFSQAADEGRFLFAPFEADDAAPLAGAPILGAMSGDDGRTPHVDIGLNDMTGSKMSYYLRYETAIEARSCRGARQQLVGSMLMRQSIDPAEARELPDYVTGGGEFGTEPGFQLVAVRIYGPFGGTIENVRIDGEDVEPEYGLSIDGRPVVSLAVSVEATEDLPVTWEMTTGPGQTDGVVLSQTPSVVAEDLVSTTPTAC